MADARMFGADPDPGCSDPSDATESSEIAPPPCAPVTVAITLADGRVAKLRADWC